MAAPPLIADRGEFVDALALLRRGCVLVHGEDASDERCIVGGQLMYTVWRPLSDNALLEELPPSPGPRERLHCYRLSERGLHFAERACADWKRRPLWQRVVARIVG